MSRSTQFIGLTKRAREYVANLIPLGEIDQLTGGKLGGSVANGMFDEEIPLGVWRHPERGVIKEVVQETPWSSGPMIFTRLSWDIGNQIEIVDGKEVVVPMDIPMFEWVHDPTIREEGYEYDEEKGTLWV